MADTVQAGAAVGSGPSFATDSISSIHHPYAKIEWGADGTANSVDDTSGKRLPVNIAESTLIGSVTETAPSTDTASSGLSGRLQRIAQRLTSLIALFPSSLGTKTKAASLAVTLASDEDALPITDNASSLTIDSPQLPTTLGSKTAANSFPVTLSTDGPFVLQTGATTETAPATDTASSGLNGRLQRIAQRMTSLITVFPTSLGQKAKADSFPVTLASNEDPMPVTDNGGSLTVDGSVSITGTVTTSGTVTANAGTNLNTSLLALETGGNLAAIKTDVDRIPVQGQALAAASLPVVLPAAQITTLTPPAAITGFALDATIGTTNTEIGIVTETAPATDTASSGLNGRLQRIAQRVTSLIALFPAALISGRLDVNLGAAPATVTITPSAAIAITDNAGSLTVDTPQLPAALVSSRLDVNLGASGITLPVSGSLTDGGSGKTLKTAVVALAASGNIVAAVSGKIIKVYAYEIQSRNDTMTAQILDDLAGNVVSIRWTLNAREGSMAGAVNPPAFLFKNSAQNKPIYANITGTGTVDILIRYWDDDAA